MHTLNSLRKSIDELPTTDPMPVLFIGHGSPMNAIENNEFSSSWRKIGAMVPKPRAILCISAHWQTQGTWVTAIDQPRTIHDFYGFPEELFRQSYAAPGAPDFAKATQEIVTVSSVGLDESWGFDHGTWSVLIHMFPKADIPTFQLSLDVSMKPEFHYSLGRDLTALRRRGVMIIGSGNIVHNLRLMNWDKPDGYDWAVEFDEKIKQFILNDDRRSMVHYANLGRTASLSVPTNEHYLPLLYGLALREEGDRVEFFNEKMVMGSISMRSFLVQPH